MADTAGIASFEENTPLAQVNASVASVVQNTSVVTDAVGSAIAAAKASVVQTTAVAPVVATDADPTTKGDASLVLVGSLTFVMILYYYMNCRRKRVVSNTWSMIVTAVSIFAAVLLYGTVGKAINLIMNWDEAANPPTGGDIMNAAVQLVFWWYLVTIVLFITKGSPLHLKAYGTIGGHICGFAALEVFGEIAQSSTFNTSSGQTVLVIVIQVAALSLLFYSSRGVAALMKKYAGDDDEEDYDAWHDQSHDTGMDFFGLTTGFMISMFVRFLISGEVPSIDGELGGKSAGEATALVCTGLAFLAVATALAFVHPSGNNPLASLFDFGTNVITLAGAFCTLFGVMWAVHGAWSETMGHIAVACLFSLIAIVYIIKISLINQYRPQCSTRALNAWFNGIGLAVGLSWEKVFDSAMDGIGDTQMFEGTSDKSKATATMLLSLWLFLVVFPAWMLYMMPKGDEDLQKTYRDNLAEGPLPVSACCRDPREVDSDLEDSIVEDVSGDVSAREPLN